MESLSDPKILVLDPVAGNPLMTPGFSTVIWRGIKNWLLRREPDLGAGVELEVDNSFRPVIFKHAFLLD